MLNIYEKDKVYHDEFSFYFDRGKNINVVFSFNFMNLIMDTINVHDSNFLQTIKDDYKIRVFLTRQEEYGNYLQEFDDVSKTNLLNNLEIDSYFCKKYVGDLKGKYNILVKIYYGQEMQKYIDFELSKKHLDITERNHFSNIKIINEPKYAFFEQKSSNLYSEYNFISENIDMNFDKYFILNLYEIYQNNIEFQTIYDFLSLQEKQRGIPFDGTLATNYFYDKNSVSRLDYDFNNNRGITAEYFKLLTKIFSRSPEQDRYNKINFIDNVFIQENEKTARKKTIQDYERLVDSLTSTSCENNLFQDYNEKKHMSLETLDILLLSLCYNKYKDLNIDNFWKENISLLPVYILDKHTKYKLYFLSKIENKSMTQEWSLLDKTNLENLKEGRYLCKISTNDVYLSNSLLENYFILNK
jgi:hypothetical protein